MTTQSRSASNTTQASRNTNHMPVQVRQTGLDFIQWHQKYYWEAVHCKALFPPNSACNFIGFLAYGTTQQASRTFLQDICTRLMRLYTGELNPLIQFIAGRPGLPPEVQDYFLPLRTMRELRNRSNLRVRSPPVRL